MFFLKKFKEATSSPQRKKLIENFSSLVILQGLNYALPLVTFPYLVRILGPEKFGLINFAQSFIYYFVILTDYGFNYSANREVSINRENIEKISHIYSSVTVIKIFLFIMSFFILSVIVSFTPKFHVYSKVYYFTFLMVFGNILFPTWLFQGLERMRYITVLNFVAKLLFTVCIFIFVRSSLDYYLVPLINSLGYFTAGLISVWIVYKRFKVKFVIPTVSEIKHQLKGGWHIFVSTVAISAYTNTRLFAVGMLCNEAITGYFAIAEKFINVIKSVFLIPLVQTVYPRLSKIYSYDPKRSYQLMTKLQKFTSLAYIILFPIIYFGAKELINIVAGHIYYETVVAFRLLLIGTLFVSLNAFQVQYLLISGRNKLFAKIHIIAGVVGILLTLFFTYWFSYKGSAYALIIIESSVFYMTFESLRRNHA